MTTYLPVFTSHEFKTLLIARLKRQLIITDKKENQDFSIYKEIQMEQLQRHL
jgi:hypothetical protein